jgi:O-antigen/teichoic acid export membrane protein
MRFSTLAQRARQSSFLRELASYAGSVLFMQAARFLLSLYGARSIGPTRWGVWILASVAVTYTPLLDLGVSNGMYRELPLWRGRGDSKQLGQIWNNSLSVFILTTALCLPALLLCAKFPVLQGIGGVLVYFIFFLLLSRTNEFFSTYARATGNFRCLSQSQFALGGILILSCFIYFRTGGRSLDDFLLVNIVAFGVSAAAMLRILPRSFRWSFNPSQLKRLINIGAPLALVNVAYALLSTADRWTVGVLLGVQQVGYYSLAGISWSALRLLPSIVSQQVFPRMGEAWGRSGSAAELRYWVRRQNVLGVLCSIPVVAIMVFLFPYFVERFMPAYKPGISAMQVLSLGFLLQPIGFGYANVLILADRQWAYLAIQLTALTLNIVLGVVFIKLGMSIVGAALGNALTFAVYALALWAYGSFILRDIDRRNMAPAVALANAAASS